MRFFSSGQDYIVILQKGEELKETLTDFVKKTRLDSAWLQAIGAALEVELAYYHLESQEYQWKTFAGPLEITNLTGNISSKDGEPLFHIHGTLTNESYGAIGGHIRTLKVAATCEIFVQKFSLKLTRKHDPDVGLELLQEV